MNPATQHHDPLSWRYRILTRDGVDFVWLDSSLQVLVVLQVKAS